MMVCSQYVKILSLTNFIICFFLYTCKNKFHASCLYKVSFYYVINHLKILTFLISLILILYHTFIYIYSGFVAQIQQVVPYVEGYFKWYFIIHYVLI